MVYSVYGHTDISMKPWAGSYTPTLGRQEERRMGLGKGPKRTLTVFTMFHLVLLKNKQTQI